MNTVSPSTIEELSSLLARARELRAARQPVFIRRIVAYLDGLQAKVDDLRRLQAETHKELDALSAGILA